MTTYQTIAVLPLQMPSAVAVPGLRKKIENYSFVPGDSIGKGYSSTVYRGKNDRSGEDVAIKVVDLSSLKDATSKQLLATQIDCLRETDHPNILRFYDYFYTRNNCYIVTEYCSGGDLQSLLKHEKHSEEVARCYFRQILQGYAHLSKVGFIHRDLKPANILIGNDGKLRIGDFGFSKRRSINEREVYNVGTPIFMPLESLTTNTYNEKTDTWALAITLYQIVYGQVPFRGASEVDLKNKIQTGISSFPSQPVTSNEFKHFIRRSLQNDPKSRMGLGDMLNHPWVTQIVPETQLRPSRQLSLKTPMHCKSNATLLGGKSKRGGQSLQRLKLHHKRPLNNTLSRQKTTFDEEKENKVTQKYNTKGNTITTQTAVSSRKSVTLGGKGRKGSILIKKSKQQKKEQNSKRIVSLINYFRLLYQIKQRFKVTSTAQKGQAKKHLEQIQVFIERQLCGVFRMHIQTIKTKMNVFNLDNDFWSQFKESNQWKRYCFVIEQYQHKYAQILTLDSSDRGQFSPMTPSREGINSKLAEMVKHLDQLNLIIQEKGWEGLSTAFSDPRVVSGELNETSKPNLSSQQQIRRM